MFCSPAVRLEAYVNCKTIPFELLGILCLACIYYCYLDKLGGSISLKNITVDKIFRAVSCKIRITKQYLIHLVHVCM